MLLGAGLPWQEMELEMMGGWVLGYQTWWGWVELSSRRRWPREEFLERRRNLSDQKWCLNYLPEGKMVLRERSGSAGHVPKKTENTCTVLNLTVRSEEEVSGTIKRD